MPNTPLSNTPLDHTEKHNTDENTVILLYSTQGSLKAQSLLCQPIDSANLLKEKKKIPVSDDTQTDIESDSNAEAITNSESDATSTASSSPNALDTPNAMQSNTLSNCSSSFFKPAEPNQHPNSQEISLPQTVGGDGNVSWDNLVNFDPALLVKPA